MTISEALKKASEILDDGENENCKNEALWILEYTLNITATHIFMNSDEIISDEKSELYFSKIGERANGRPVQYILGTWEFFGREFAVGEGVLIPRPETELLVENVIGYLEGIQNPVVIDLCAGSGCIGLSIACERPDATVYLVEKYDEAFHYLELNSKKLNTSNAKLIKADMFSLPELPKADFLVSNPPYIATDEIASLQKEVRKEPVTALDGGEDGLIFYRAIAEMLPSICKGACAVECGEDQAQSISELFGECSIIKDFSGTDRVVMCRMEKNNVI